SKIRYSYESSRDESHAWARGAGNRAGCDPSLRGTGDAGGSAAPRGRLVQQVSRRVGAGHRPSTVGTSVTPTAARLLVAAYRTERPGARPLRQQSLRSLMSGGPARSEVHRSRGGRAVHAGSPARPASAAA